MNKKVLTTTLVFFCVLVLAIKAQAYIKNVPPNFYTDIGISFCDVRAFADTAQEIPMGDSSFVGYDDMATPDPNDPNWAPIGFVGIQESLTDHSVTSFAYYSSGGSPFDAYVNLYFTDRMLVNGPGYDVALFTVYTTPYDVRLNIAGPNVSVTPIDTGYGTMDFGGVSSYAITLAKLDLSDLGMADWESTNVIQVDMVPDPVTGGQPYLSLVGNLHTFIDIGLRLYDGTEIVTIACEPEGTPASPLRIAKNGTIYGIALVDPADSSATTIRIETASGTKALAKLP